MTGVALRCAPAVDVDKEGREREIRAMLTGLTTDEKIMLRELLRTFCTDEKEGKKA